MTGSNVTVGWETPAYPLVTGNPDAPRPGVLFNQSDTVTFYIGNDVNVNPADPAYNTPVPPGQYLPFDGTESIYGICAEPSSCPVGVMFGVAGTPWNSNIVIDGPAVVNVEGNVQVVGDGGYILPGQATALFNSVGIAIPPGVTSLHTLGPISCATYQSLDIACSELDLPASYSALGCVLLVSWYDNNSVLVGIDRLGVMGNPMGVLNPPTMNASLPCRGVSFGLGMVNLSSGGTTPTFLKTGALTVFGSFRSLPSPLYQCDLSNLIGQTLNGWNLTGNQSADVGYNYYSSGWVMQVHDTQSEITMAYVMNGYYGPVRGVFNLGESALAAGYIVDLTQVLNGSGTVSGNPGTILPLSTGVTGDNVIDYTLPMSPCAMVIDYGSTATVLASILESR